MAGTTSQRRPSLLEADVKEIVVPTQNGCAVRVCRYALFTKTFLQQNETDFEKQASIVNEEHARESVPRD